MLLIFLHNSLRRHYLAQARIVSSSKYALWTVFARAGNYSPRRESSSLKLGYTRPGEEAPGASVLSGVLSPRREIFRPNEEVFSPRREYFRSGENRRCSLDYLGDKFFAQARGIFARAKLVSPKPKKKFFFFLAFCFWMFSSFGMQCMYLVKPINW